MSNTVDLILPSTQEYSVLRWGDDMEILYVQISEYDVEILYVRISEYDVERSVSTHLWGLTWRSGSLTRLASDLSRARQKYVCMVQL